MADVRNPFDTIDQHYASTAPPAADANPFDTIDTKYAEVNKTAGETGTKQPEPISPDVPEPSAPVEPATPYNPFNPYVDPYPTIKPTPDMKAPPGIVPDISTRIVPPQFKERQGRTLYQNAADDIQDNISGILSLTNASVLRGVQAAPQELQAIGLPAQSRPLFGNITKSYEKAAEELDRAHDAGQQPDMGKAISAAMQHAAQDPDAKAIGNMIKGMVDYAYPRYIEPWGHGLAPGAEALEEQLWKHPVGTPLDLGLFPALRTGAGTTANVAGAAARRVPAAMLDAGTKVGQRYGTLKNMAALRRWGREQYEGLMNGDLDKSWLGRNWQVPMQYKSKVLVASNPLQAPWQVLQNAAAFALTHINSPADILYGLVAMNMALDPKIRKLIPESFFGGQAGQLAVSLPKWLSTLIFPDKLMDMHLGLISKGDDYWRAASAVMQALRETAQVGNAKQFKLLADTLNLSYQAQRQFQRLLSDPIAQTRYLQEVHRVLGNYGKDLKGAEAVLGKNVMFYKALRHMMILSASFPDSNPFKAAAIHAIGQVGIKMAESEPMNKKMKEAGAALVRDKNGKVMTGPNMGPMVYLKGGGLSPLLMAPQDLLWLMKVANGEGLEENEATAAVFHPFMEIAQNVYNKRKTSGEEFYDPNSIRTKSGQTAKKTVLDKKGRKLTAADITDTPVPPLASLVAQSMFPSIYKPMQAFYERIQKIPGAPSDFTVPFVQSAPQRTNKGLKKKPPKVDPFSAFVFTKLQPTETGVDATKKEKSMLDSQINDLMKSYYMRRGQWQ